MTSSKTRRAGGKPASTAGKLTKCSRGHKFLKNSEYPVCPICWPGYYASK